MSKLRITRIKLNPKRKRSGRPSRGRAATKKRFRRPSHTARRMHTRQWIIEAFEQKKSFAAFRYWNGRNFTPQRHSAMKFDRERAALDWAKALRRKGLPRSIRFLRVVPA